MGITVSDTEVATTFYRAVTGGEVFGPFVKSGRAVEAATGHPGAEVVLTFIRIHDDVHLELVEYKNIANQRIDPNNGHIGAAHPAIIVDDIDTTLARIAELGYSPLSATMTGTAGPLDGHRYVYVLGPDDVRVELLQPPH